MEHQPKGYRKRKREGKNRNRKRACSKLRSNENLKPEIEIVSAGGLLLRVVHPYVYTFCSFAKGRWVGRTLLEIYCQEFGAYPRSYYELAIEQGRIMVSDTKVPATHKIQGTDVLMHHVHRHEPAVAVALEQSPHVTIVGETDDLLAVDKPATLPVHPCGGYHLNSLTELLGKSYPKLFTIHRLDRLTSGLVILAKSNEIATTWGRAVQDRDCQKIYLARVKGRFGRNITDIPKLERSFPIDGEYVQMEEKKSSEEKKADIARQRNAHGYWFTTIGEVSSITMEEFCRNEYPVEQVLSSLDETKPPNKSIVWLNVACPVRVKDPKNGVCESGKFAELDDETYVKSVKAAQTSFVFLKYNEKDNSTLLLVRPQTGRTHQIRIHLQYLGHSIANDPNYGGDMWYGNPEGQQACSKAQEILDKTSGLNSNDTPATETEVANMIQSGGDKGLPLDKFNPRTCIWCARNDGMSVAERAKLEFLVRSPGLWLHALQYKVNNVCFRTDLPSWGT